ncbi:ROK family transcriptional regulator [Mucilaginibacter gynuensis]|uniref:ROK family transcriptional regulator n=1 Tax=Mucilaginibacter gynuensis TaxID=1302236 RepID=A0ABP8GI78_9SPHI
MKVSLKTNIIKKLYFDKEQSCNEMSLYFKKSVPVISKAVNELIADGVVVEQGLAPSSGGRRPVMYSLKANEMYLLTVAMDQLSTRIGMVDMQNNHVAETRMVELYLPDNSEALDKLVGLINAYIADSGIPKSKILAVGIGMPGFINVNEGVNYSYLQTEGESLVQYLERATELTVHLDNDSSLVALSELRFGIARSKRDAMVINLGWGIGLGMIIGGELFRGHNGFAGELSHIPLSEDGALCSCGKQGCLEAEASMLVVAQKAVEGIRNGRVSILQQTLNSKNESKLIGDALMAAANKGDQYAIELLTEAGYKIGKALSILIHIMNPECIILSGRGALVGKILLAPIQQALIKYCIPRLAANTEVLISDLGFDGELIGAAVVAMENLNDESKIIQEAVTH